VLPFASSFLAIVAAFVIPAIIGLLLVSAAARYVSPKYLAAFTLGLYFWFFSDTIGDAAYLDVNSGFTGGVEQVVLVILFAVGILLVFSLDRDTFASESFGSRMGLAIPLLVAFAVGFHGFGEGAAFSGAAATTPATGLLGAFGGTTAAAAFIIHKALEPMMIGAAYWVYTGDRGKDPTRLAKDILILTVVFVLPGVVGAATNYFLLYDTTYFFAFGLGTSIYAAVRLAKPLFATGATPGWESTKIALLILLGFLCLYLAALLHS
jgi:hypothetical protein